MPDALRRGDLGATGKPELGRGGLRSACRTGRACTLFGLGVARGAWLLTLGEGSSGGEGG